MTKATSSEIMGYRISYNQMVCLSCYEQKFWHRTADWKDPTPIPASSDPNIQTPAASVKPDSPPLCDDY